MDGDFTGIPSGWSDRADPSEIDGPYSALVILNIVPHIADSIRNLTGSCDGCRCAGPPIKAEGYPAALIG